MAPGRARRILVREMIVLENIQRHFLILRSRYQRSSVAELGRRRCRVAIPLRYTSAGGIILPRGSEKDQYRSRFAPSNRRPLAEHSYRSRPIHTKEGAA